MVSSVFLPPSKNKFPLPIPLVKGEYRLSDRDQLSLSALSAIDDVKLSLEGYYNESGFFMGMIPDEMRV